MKIVFTLRAARQLDEILRHIVERHPRGAKDVKARIKAMFDLLLEHLLSGTATGHREGRRIVTNPCPYLIHYRVRGDHVVIQRIRHAARRPV